MLARSQYINGTPIFQRSLISSRIHGTCRSMFFVTGFMFFITVLNIIVYYLKQNQKEDTVNVKYSMSPPYDEDQRCRRFSLAEIKLATLNFSDSLVIGKGGFGKVYKGVINSLGTSPVAMKRLDLDSNQGSLEFLTEIEMLSKFQHGNILALIGYCEAEKEMILIYEYMPGGTLEDHVHISRRSRKHNSSLTWEQRLKICIGAARGLDYLHTGTGTLQRVIHRDVKTANILLDDNLAAKVSDFGLSRISPSNYDCTTCVYTNNIKCTFGYMDAAMLMLQLPMKVSGITRSRLRWIDRRAIEDKHLKSLQFDLKTIRVATGDFCRANMIGHGSSSIVYKGRLPNGLQIAVKRFYTQSRRDPHEYQNELLLLSKLQHRNLVRLLGYCLEGRRILLFHEYLPNTSLHSFLSGDVFSGSLQRAPLNWEARHRIIVGVAQGLVYLHEYSSVKILHKETNTKHILLDETLEPKISDFGLAKGSIGYEPYYCDTSITGTLRYMEPEYVLRGDLSLKVDVFNFGILILETITGIKDTREHTGEDFLSYVWRNWQQDDVLKLIDPKMDTGSSLIGDITRCIQIGLLCAQHNVVERPTMATIVLMLSSQSLTIPVPAEPRYSYFPSDSETYITSSSGRSIS